MAGHKRDTELLDTVSTSYQESFGHFEMRSPTLSSAASLQSFRPAGGVMAQSKILISTCVSGTVMRLWSLSGDGLCSCCRRIPTCLWRTDQTLPCFLCGALCLLFSAFTCGATTRCGKLGPTEAGTSSLVQHVLLALGLRKFSEAVPFRGEELL